MSFQQPTDADRPTDANPEHEHPDTAAYAVDLDEQRILFGIEHADVQQYLVSDEWTVLLTPSYRADTDDDPIEVDPHDAITVDPGPDTSTDRTGDDSRSDPSSQD